MALQLARFTPVLLGSWTIDLHAPMMEANRLDGAKDVGGVELVFP